MPVWNWTNRYIVRYRNFKFQFLKVSMSLRYVVELLWRIVFARWDWGKIVQEIRKKSYQITNWSYTWDKICPLLAVLTVHRTTGKNRVCQMNKHLLSKETPSSSEHHDLDVCSHHLQLMYITMGWIIFWRNFLISTIKQFSPDIYLNCRYYILIDEIAPHFAQLTQNLTSDCWLI